jgi:transmembrane sensor
MDELPSDDRSSKEVRAEAAAWLARLHAEDRTPADEAAFRTWRASRAAHAAAFDHLTELWTTAGGLSADVAEMSRAKRLGAKRSRRMILAGGGALLAGGAAFGAWEAAFAGVYETGVGEQRHVALSDGSQMLLDTDTRVRAKLGRHTRKLLLYRGRASLRIAPDAARPFVVASNGSAVVSPHGILDVRVQGRRMSVLMLQGEASLQPSDETGRAREIATEPPGQALTSGVRAVLDQDRPAVIDRPEVAPLTAWQNGQAIFDDEPLSQAIAELNRYSTVKLRAADAATAQMRISGVYRVGDNVAFARSVSRLLPLSVEVDDSDIVLVSDANGVRHAV